MHFRQVRAAKVFLIAMSFWFYGYFNVSYLFIMACSIGGNYLFHRLLSRRARKEIMILAVALNLSVLFYFKYYDFFISTVNTVFGTSAALKHILLPLGISFFTFQQISFVIDTYRGEVKDCPLADYALFVSFFPQLIAGPIVNHDEMLPQFERIGKEYVQWEKIAEGFGLFILGLSKKVLLADTFGAGVDYGYANVELLGRADAALVIFFYAMQLYFDFSGYSDMAMGLGRMFNIILPVNFNSPYRACSVKELWQRWHMTLSRFFITYVYIPLGGSKKGKLRTILNTIIIFFLSGLWHGAAWTYIAWGTMQGLLVVWDNLGIVGIRGRKEKHPSRFHIPAWLGWILTFGFFNLSLFFFRSQSMAGAVQMFRNLGAFNYTGKMFEIASTLDIPEFYIIKEALGILAPQLVGYAYLGLLFLYLGLSFFMINRPNVLEIAENGKLTSGKCWAVALVFLWCVVSLSQVSTFLYFNF